jgi:hypothetical protein
VARYKNLADRLLTNCIHAACRILETPCWQSTFATCNKGYAVCSVRVPGKRNPQARRAHILLWELVTGRKVRDGYTLDHRCMNKKCIRPDHLEEVPRAVNTARMRAHYRRLSAQETAKTSATPAARSRGKAVKSRRLSAQSRKTDGTLSAPALSCASTAERPVDA